MFFNRSFESQSRGSPFNSSIESKILSHLQHNSGQIFSFVQISRAVLSHALIRSHFLLKLTNQMPSWCLLPRFAAKLRPFLTVLTTIPNENIARSAMSIFIKISREMILHSSNHNCTRYHYAIAKISRLVAFENHLSHFCAANPRLRHYPTLSQFRAAYNSSK